MQKLWHTMEYNKAVNMIELMLPHQCGSQSKVNGKKNQSKKNTYCKTTYFQFKNEQN